MTETPRKRSYQPGHRRTKGKTAANAKGLLTKSRWAWAEVYFGKFIIWGDYAQDDDGNETDELLDIKLMFPIPNRPTVSWNLTALTEEELVSLKHLFDTAFEWAKPYCIARDKEAQDALDNGDDSHSRIYRQVPKLVYRSGPEPEHREGVQHGSSDDARVLQSDGDLEHGLRDEGGLVAERDEDGGRPQDDGPTPHEPPVVRSLGEVADGPE